MSLFVCFSYDASVCFVFASVCIFHLFSLSIPAEVIGKICLFITYYVLNLT